MSCFGAWLLLVSILFHLVIFTLRLSGMFTGENQIHHHHHNHQFRPGFTSPLAIGLPFFLPFFSVLHDSNPSFPCDVNTWSRKVFKVLVEIFGFWTHLAEVTFINIVLIVVAISGTSHGVANVVGPTVQIRRWQHVNVYLHQTSVFCAIAFLLLFTHGNKNMVKGFSSEWSFNRKLN